MDDLQAMKGPGTRIVTIFQEGHITRLHRFFDGSLGIDRDGRPLGVWEPDEVTSCLEMFFRTATPPSTVPTLVYFNIGEHAIGSHMRDCTQAGIDRN